MTIAPWQADEVSWVVPLQTRLRGNFLPSVWMESGIPGTGFQAPPISESQSLNLLNGTPLEGSLFTVKRILDFTEPLIWGVRFTGQGRQGWEGTLGVRLGLGECPLGIRSPEGSTKRARARALRERVSCGGE